MGIPRLLKIILPNPDQEILGFPVSGGGVGRFGPLVNLAILVNKRFFFLLYAKNIAVWKVNTWQECQFNHSASIKCVKITDLHFPRKDSVVIHCAEI